MAKILIQTQVYENYGAHDWDGQGECPQYWKAKGGNDYRVHLDAVTDAPMLVVETIRPEIERDTVGYRETIVDWELVDDDALTASERDQLEFDGEIKYPAKELWW